MNIQQTPTLIHPDWQDVPGSETTSSATLPMESNTGFCRLAKP